MRKHHFHLQYFSFYDLDGMARHLERMAAKGWMLEKMTAFGWHYRRMEPKRLRFTVTYQDTFSVFDPTDSAGQMEYQDLCQKSGWTVAAANGPLQAFYTEDEDAPPIETDPQLVLETVEKLAKRTLPNLLILVLAVLQLTMFVRNLQQFPILALSSPAQLAIPLVWMMIFVIYVVELTSYLCWHRKACIAAKTGEFPTCSSHPWRRIFLLAVLSVIVCYALLASKLPYLVPMLLGITVILSLVFFLPGTVHGILKRRGVSARVNRRWTIAASIAATVFVMGMLTVFLFTLVGNPVFYSRKAPVESPLTMADLTQVDNLSYTFHTELEESPLLRHLTCRQDAPSGSDLPDLLYEIVDVKFAPVYQLCLNNLTAYYVPAEPAPPGLSALYGHAEGYPSYILCWDNRLVRISTDVPLTQSQLETAAALLTP